MQVQFEHEKRQTVPGTLHGTINQISKSMFHAFVNAYMSDRDFYIVTEDTTFGDFDDLVLVTGEGFVTAIQYKHVKNVTDNSTITFNDVTTVSGDNKELMFYKYYLSLVSQRPQWKNEQRLMLELASNSPIDQNLSICLNPDTKMFNDAFFSETTSLPAFLRQIIIASILKHTGRLDKIMPKDVIPYGDYLDCFYKNYKEINPNSLDEIFNIFRNPKQSRYNKEEKIRIIKKNINELKSGSRSFTQNEWKNLCVFLKGNVIPYIGIKHLDVIMANEDLEKDQVILFLKKIRFSHSEPSKDTTIANIKRKLLDIFKQGQDAADVLYHSFFYDFMEWLACEKVTQISNHDIKLKFASWQNRLLQLQRWIGISSVYQQNLVTTIGGHQFDRADFISELNVFKKSESRALVIFGERGMGKSTILHQYITLTRQYDSDFLMLDVNAILKSLSLDSQINKCAFNFFHACQMIVLENCEDIGKYTNELIKEFERLLLSAAKNIKFVFLYRAQSFILKDNLFGIAQKDIRLIEMQKLNKQSIIKIFPFIFELSQPSRQLTLHPRTQPNPLLDSIICHPFYLKLLVAYYDKNRSLSVNFSSKDDFVKEILESLLTPGQLSVVRRLIYLISQEKETGILQLTNEFELQELIKQTVLIKEGNNYLFSHKLYEEWALREAIEMRLTCMIESNDDIFQIYQDIIKVLPSNQKEIYIFLGENNALTKYRRLLLTIAPDETFIENNNVYLLKLTFKNLKNSSYEYIAKNISILYVLVDSAPEALLEILFDMANINRICYNGLDGNEKFKQDFCTVLIRGFCISRDMVKAGKLFYKVLQKLSQLSAFKKYGLSYYMDSFFVNSLAGDISMGLMGHQEKLRFLRFHCESIGPDSEPEDQNYFHYVYQGLLKAVDPGESGDAYRPEHKCYFSTGRGNEHDYVDYKGNSFNFLHQDPSLNANYNCEAIRILINYYNCQKNSEFNLFLEPQTDILKLFENNLVGTTYILGSNLLFIIDIATIIAAEIHLDSGLFDCLTKLLSEAKLKIEANFSDLVSKEHLHNIFPFNPNESYKLEHLHIQRVEEILLWRNKNEYKIYDLKEANFLLSHTYVPQSVFAKSR